MDHTSGCRRLGGLKRLRLKLGDAVATASVEPANANVSTGAASRCSATLKDGGPRCWTAPMDAQPLSSAIATATRTSLIMIPSPSRRIRWMRRLTRQKFETRSPYAHKQKAQLW